MNDWSFILFSAHQLLIFSLTTDSNAVNPRNAEAALWPQAPFPLTRRSRRLHSP